MMKNIIFNVLYIFSLRALSIETTHLPLGESLSLPLTSTRVWIEDGKILKGEVAGTKLNIFGLKEGASLIGLGNTKYQIYVIHPKKQNSHRLISSILEKTLGLKVAYAHGQIVIAGELLRLNDWKALADQMKTEDADYKMSAKLSHKLTEEAERYFKDLFENNKLPPQGLIFSDNIELRIPPESPHLSGFKKILRPYGISVIEDKTSLALEPTIKVQVTIAEVQKQMTQKIGLRWPDSYQAKILPEAVWNFESLDVMANFFEQNGQGKILASPNLICRSGKDAEFLAGGEFPIKVSNFKQQNVIWKKYGILLKVRPQADSLGQINIQIDTEVSSLDPSKAIDGIPGLITHKVSSHFDLKKPQTIVLSGLIRNEESKSSDGLPWLSRIPILGALFSSKDFKENRTELLIFVRPEILNLEQNQKPRHLDVGSNDN
jgi:pilus assembly protein CpaC